MVDWKDRLSLLTLRHSAGSSLSIPCISHSVLKSSVDIERDLCSEFREVSWGICCLRSCREESLELEGKYYEFILEEINKFT